MKSLNMIWNSNTSQHVNWRLSISCLELTNHAQGRNDKLYDKLLKNVRSMKTFLLNNTMF